MANHAPTNVATVASSSNPSFPIEIWSIIVKFLTVKTELELPKATAELMCMRLVSKALRDLATPLLYDSIELSLSAKSFDNARHITENFKDHIKTIYISPRAYKIIDQAEFNIRVHDTFGTRPDAEWQEHCIRGFSKYCRDMRVTHDILIDHELGFQLIRSLSKLLSNIPRVAIRASRYNMKYGDNCLDEVCPHAGGWRNCSLSQDQHKDFCLAPTERWDSLSAGACFLQNLFQGLSSSQQSVEELVIMPENGDVSLHPLVFDGTGDTLLNMKEAFSKLRKLKLDLTTAEIIHGGDSDAWNNGSIAKVMKEAKNLRTLMIIAETHYNDNFQHRVVYGYQGSTFRAVLNGCTFSDLESLYLANFTATDTEIIEFLERHPNLESLVIDGFLLSVGLWEDIAEYLRGRRNQGLTVVSLNNLNFGFQTSAQSPCQQNWQNLYGGWEQFFVGNGPNPFSSTEFAWYCVKLGINLPHTNDLTSKDRSYHYREWFP